MDNHQMIPLLLAFLFILLPNICNSVTNYHHPICTQTPHPELCNSLVISSTPQKTLDENWFDFREVSLRAALVQAENTHKQISDTDLSSFNELAKSAWKDCVDLYEDTIYQLNRSIVASRNDAQTWLSSSIANEQACRNGFLDFNLSSSDIPVVASDFSKYLSNSLSINKAVVSSSSASASLHSTKQKRNRRLLAADFDDFPEWVSSGDRRMLQSSGSTRADIVVAQDGSGSYKTINEALAAADKQRSGTKRFVIYVKKGVYKENVEVKRSMKNLMFIGDGIDATIVTGSKNVQDGSTTFRSATFGEFVLFLFYFIFIQFLN